MEWIEERERADYLSDRIPAHFVVGTLIIGARNRSMSDGLAPAAGHTHSRNCRPPDFAIEWVTGIKSRNTKSVLLLQYP